MPNPSNAIPQGRSDPLRLLACTRVLRATIERFFLAHVPWPKQPFKFRAGYRLQSISGHHSLGKRHHGPLFHRDQYTNEHSFPS